MEQYVIKGGNPLVGDVTISGAKNAALGILAASIMTDDDVLIDNLPDVRDINVLLEAIEEIGARVERIDRHTVRINGSNIKEVAVDDGILGGLKDILFGTTGPRGGKKDGVVQTMAKSAARQVTNQIVRGMLGSLLGGRRR